MTIEIKNLQCISTLLANYADKIISINEGSSSNKRIESLIELAKKNGVKTISSKSDFSAICKQPIIQDIKDKDLDFGEVVLVLVDGADITNEIADAVADYQAGRLQAFGKDLGDIASFLSDTVHCNTFVCKVVEGILDGADLVLSDLKQCESDLSQAEDDFVNSFKSFKVLPRIAFSDTEASESSQESHTEAPKVLLRITFSETEASESFH